MSFLFSARKRRTVVKPKNGMCSKNRVLSKHGNCVRKGGKQYKRMLMSQDRPSFRSIYIPKRRFVLRHGPAHKLATMNGLLSPSTYSSPLRVRRVRKARKTTRKSKSPKRSKSPKKVRKSRKVSKKSPIMKMLGL